MMLPSWPTRHITPSMARTSSRQRNSHKRHFAPKTVGAYLSRAQHTLPGRMSMTGMQGRTFPRSEMCDGGRS
jgi:hypothetical protein